MTHPTPDPEVRAQLDALVGEPSGEPFIAPDRVNEAMIRHWADALGDANPVYTDLEFATSSRFGGIVAPPVMLQTWTMPRPTIEGIIERGGIPIVLPQSGSSLLDELGFTGSVATNSEFEIERYVHPGELISSTSVIEDISDEKHTARGPGHFRTTLTTYYDEQGNVVGRQRFRLLKFKPQAG
jgi:hypothetical protein